MVSNDAVPTKSQPTDIQPYTELPRTAVQNFTTLEDVERFYASQGFTISHGEEISDGFDTLDNKDTLLAQAFMLVDWNRFWSEKFNQHAFTMRVLTAQGAKYRVADGSTGIAKQLEEITAVRANDPTKFPNGGLFVKNGLRKSEYWISKADGHVLGTQEAEQTAPEDKRKAVTYYLDL